MLRYWENALSNLETSDRTFADMYRIMFGFGDNVYFAWNENGSTAEMTYDACRVCIEAAAQAFSATLKTVEKDAFVGLQKENSPTWVIAFFALLMSGYRPLLLPSDAEEAKVRRLLVEAGATALAADAPLAGILHLDISTLARPPLAETVFSPRWADKTAVCTSGTGGAPRICVYDGRAICAQILNSRAVMRENSTIETYDRGRLKLLAFLPFFHVFGLVAGLLWFSFFGCTFVFLRDYAPRTIADTCRRHGVTHVFGVPLLFRSAADAVLRQAETEGRKDTLLRAIDASLWIQTACPRLGAAFVRNVLFRAVRARVLGPTVRFCITGGGFVSEETLRVMNGLGYALYNGYGATETGICSVELRLRASDRLSGSVGRPFPSCKYRIRDGEQTGELEISGGSLFVSRLCGGREVMRTDDWYRTGDLATLDASGRCTVLGRLDDLIVTDGGENLLPDALEEAFAVPHVLRTCAVGVRAGDGRTTVTVAAELEPGLSPYVTDTTLELLEQANLALPPGKRAGRILITDAPLPLALGGKLQRAQIKQSLEDGTLPAHELTARPSACTGGAALLEGVIAVFSEVFDHSAGKIAPDTHLVYDLGCDSLRYYTLLSRIGETYRVTLPQPGEIPPMTPAAFAETIEKLNGGRES